MKKLLVVILLTCIPALASARDTVDVICVGDIMLAYGMKNTVARHGADYPFRRVRSLLSGADVVFGNLENPISTEGERTIAKDYNFLMDPPLTLQLRRAGFKVLSMANNHMMDFGPKALANTLTLLDRNGIAHCGAGMDLAEARRSAVIHVQGKTVAFLAYTKTFPLSFSATKHSPGTALAEEAFLRRDIAEAKRNADWVVVSLHWGEEYAATPATALRSLAHAAVNAGADAVIGHHPHVAQGIELHKGKIIAYSLGNFVFGTINPNAGEGLLLKLHLRPGRPPQAVVVPILVDNVQVGFQPRPLMGEDAREFLFRLKTLSADLGTVLRIEDDRAYLP